jgi:ABC-2 type transport system ATP-binding protein
MLLGLVYATAGTIELLGRPIPARSREVLPQVGALVEGPGFWPHLSGRANLSLIDQAGPRPGPGARDRRARVDAAIQRVGLGSVGRRPVRAYSTGMAQRLGLAAALLRSPRLLILDEPTNGLDPYGIREVRDLIAGLAAEGVTVFLSSHLLGEIEQVCTHAAIVASGRLVAADRVEALLAPTGRADVRTPDVAAAAELLAGAVQVTGRSEHGLTVELDGHDPGALNRRLVDGGVTVTELVLERPSLEDVFLRLTGKGLGEEPGGGPGAA